MKVALRIDLLNWLWAPQIMCLYLSDLMKASCTKANSNNKLQSNQLKYLGTL